MILNRNIMNFISQLYVSFKKTNGFIQTTVGTLLAILSIRFESQLKLNYWWVITLFSFSIIISSLFDTALTFYRLSINTNPKIKSVIKNDKIILLLEPTELFVIESYVGIYLIQDDYEELIAIGEVINIQMNKNVAIEIINNKKPELDFSLTKDKIIIKPSIRKSYEC